MDLLAGLHACTPDLRSGGDADGWPHSWRCFVVLPDLEGRLKPSRRGVWHTGTPLTASLRGAAGSSLAGGAAARLWFTDTPGKARPCYRVMGVPGPKRS